MIKQAYINGFMRKCAEHGVDGRKLLSRIMVKQAQDGATGADEVMDTEDYVNRYLPQDIHQPITAADVGNAVTNFPDYKNDVKVPAMPLVGNMILQRFIDAMPDPGPNVRNPTPYELGEFWRRITLPYKDLKGKESKLKESFGPALSLLQTGNRSDTEDLYRDLSFYLPESLFAAQPRLQNEAIRRAWHAGTNAVPISVTSPTK